MHEPAGVVEILVQILQNTPYSEIQFQNTPLPPKMKIVRESKSESFRIPPRKLKFWNLGRSWHFKTFQFQNPPPKNWNLGRSWHFMTFQFQNTPHPENWSPPNWNLADLGTLRLFSFRIPPPPPPSPPPKNWNLGRSQHFKTFQFQNTPPNSPSPWKLKFSRSWHFKTFQFQNTPPASPPTTKIEI